MAADWSDLPSDLLLSIANRLVLPSDYIRFSAVCTSWRSVVATKAPQQHPSLQFLSLVLPNEEEQGEAFSESTRTLFSPWENKIYKNTLRLPPTEFVRGSHGPWLLCVDSTLGIYILNTLSGLPIPLPHMTTLSPLHDGSAEPSSHYFVKKAAFLTDPSSLTCAQDIVVMLIFDVFGRLAFASPNDEVWMVIENAIDMLGSEGVSQLYSDVISYKGKFYAVTNYQRVVVCDIDGPSPSVRNVISPGKQHFDDNWVDLCYLVESVKGELLQVNGKRVFVAPREQAQVGNEINGGHRVLIEKDITSSFDVYKLEEGKDKRVEVKRLGDQMFFLGVNTSFALSSTDLFGRRLRSCIYFTDTEYIHQEPGGDAGYDVGIFNIEDGKSQHRYPKGLCYVACQPFWFNPIPSSRVILF